MKKYILLLFLIGNLMFCYGQYKKPKVNLDSLKRTIPTQYSIIKISPLQFVLGNIPITTELGITGEIPSGRFTSLQLSAAYLTKTVLLLGDSSNNQSDQFRVSGTRIQFAYKFFMQGLFNRKDPWDYAPIGFYIGPHFSYAKAEISWNGSARWGVSQIFEHTHAQGIMGFQFEMGNYISDVYIGVGYKNNTIVQKTGTAIQKIDIPDGFDFIYNNNLKLTIGYRIGLGF